jgi:NADPH-dependent curcumin reductase CurA
MAPPSNYTRIVLNERPVGDIDDKTFRTETHQFSSLKVGDAQVLLQVTYLSLDPAMRGWLRDTRSYVPPVQIGEVMRAQGLGVVLEAGSESNFKPGDVVRATCGMPSACRYESQSNGYLLDRMARICSNGC